MKILSDIALFSVIGTLKKPVWYCIHFALILFNYFSPTWVWNSATWTDSGLIHPPGFLRVSLSSVCGSAAGDNAKLFCESDLIMNRKSAVSAEQHSTFPELAETFLSFPLRGTSETARTPLSWQAVSQGGLTLTKETAAVHIIHPEPASAPVYPLNGPPGH